MVVTSRTWGRFESTQSPPPNNVDARIGNAAFLAPAMVTCPFKGNPPEMTIRSNVATEQCLCFELEADRPFDS